MSTYIVLAEECVADNLIDLPVGAEFVVANGNARILGDPDYAQGESLPMSAETLSEYLGAGIIAPA